MRKELESILYSFKKELSVIYKDKLSDIILFGSQAREEAQEGSDIDILIVLREEIEPVKEIRKISDIITSLSLEFNEVISCVFVSEKKYKTEQSPLLKNVRREGISI
ncbi:MAG: hypothetical protein ACD_20C00066G0002 [uncultured bacterium]|nr:MAG: hypothetical protein ACD_20C00066G0002 [uncultured bacterium]